MFKDLLRDIVEKTDGGIAGLLMDASGIPVDSYAVADAPFDIGTVGAELSVVLKQIAKASEMLEAGSAQEISGLPFALVEEDGEKHAVPCAEILFTVRAAEAVAAKGLMPIVTMKGTDTVRLAIFQSIAEPHADLAGRWS